MARGDDTPGAGVALAALHPDHAGGLFGALTDPRIYTFLNDEPPRDVTAVRRRIETLRAGPPAGAGDIWLNWCVMSGGRIVGYVQATVAADARANIAFVLSPAVWGRGVAYAACAAMIAILRRDHPVTRLAADTEAENHRSRRLLHRLGFRETHRGGQDVYFERCP